MSGKRSAWTGRIEDTPIVPKPGRTDREVVQAQADAPYCRNAVHLNKTIMAGDGQAWFTHGREVKPKDATGPFIARLFR